LPDINRAGNQGTGSTEPMPVDQQANTWPVPPAPTATRREQLRDELLATVEHLKARRADLIGDVVIAEYVALDWLEWQGGSLKLTVTGANVCRQVARTRPYVGPSD
jgi:hypothetical protein